MSVMEAARGVKQEQLTGNSSIVGATAGLTSDLTSTASN